MAHAGCRAVRGSFCRCGFSRACFGDCSWPSSSLLTRLDASRSSATTPRSLSREHSPPSSRRCARPSATGFSARKAPTYCGSINRPIVTPQSLFGNACSARSACHPHTSFQARRWGGQSDPTSPGPTTPLNPHRARRTDGVLTPRDFVPWRFSDAGLRACGRPCHSRRPKTCTTPAIMLASMVARGHVWFRRSRWMSCSSDQWLRAFLQRDLAFALNASLHHCRTDDALPGGCGCRTTIRAGWRIVTGSTRRPPPRSVP
jgi:hypothetical protein